MMHFGNMCFVIGDSDRGLCIRQRLGNLKMGSAEDCACGRQCVGVREQRHIKVRLVYVTVVTLQHLHCKFEHAIGWILPANILRGFVYCASCASAIVSAIAIAMTIVIVLDSVISLAIAFAIASVIALATAFAIAPAISFAIASLRL